MEYEWNELVYSAKFSFEPVIGEFIICTVMLLVWTFVTDFTFGMEPGTHRHF
jgi:hypothetical protein